MIKFHVARPLFPFHNLKSIHFHQIIFSTYFHVITCKCSFHTFHAFILLHKCTTWIFPGKCLYFQPHIHVSILPPKGTTLIFHGKCLYFQHQIYAFILLPKCTTFKISWQMFISPQSPHFWVLHKELCCLYVISLQPFQCPILLYVSSIPHMYIIVLSHSLTYSLSRKVVFLQKVNLQIFKQLSHLYNYNCRVYWIFSVKIEHNVFVLQIEHTNTNSI